MRDRTSPQIKHILSDAPVAGAAPLPTSYMRQGMFDGHALPQLRTPLRRLLAFPQLLQQSFVGINTDAAARRTRGTALPQRTTGTGRRWKRHDPTGLKGHRLSAWTPQGVPCPIQLEGTFGKIRSLPHRPGLAENRQLLGPLVHQRTGQIGSVNMQFPQRAL